MFSRRQALKQVVGILGSTAFLPPVIWSQQPESLHKALYWEKKSKTVVQCSLCPHFCILKPGESGLCKARKNIKGDLYTLAYNNPCVLNVDPIEKKPLFHVLPGSKAYSIAIAGCTLHCKNCQNYTISQTSPVETTNYTMTAEEIVVKALETGCKTIAFTYSEPFAFYEYMLDVAKKSHEAGLKNILITCGYVNELPLSEVSPHIDAANIDLKSFSDSIYKKLNAGSLSTVLNTITFLYKHGVWIELTNLIIPSWTDNMKMIEAMCSWIKQNLGTDIPIHFSRFFPLYKLSHLFPTPTKTLTDARAIAIQKGLRYVYIGNVAGVDDNTYCNSCGTMVVERNGYTIHQINIHSGKCDTCHNSIPGIWT